jgi:hypothetical protein
MPESSFDHPLFGHVRFHTVSPEWKRGNKIVFLPHLTQLRRAS